jgi:hypothetical protein
MKRRLQAGLVCVFLTLAACGTGEEPALEPPQGAEDSPAVTEGGEAAVTITAPESDATLEAGGVEVTVEPENFNIVNKLGQDPVAGEGHIHFYFDVDEIPTEPGKPAVTDDAATYHAAATTSHTWSDVDAGEHTFGVQLVNNNHTPLEPPVTAEVTVTVE